MADDPIRLTVVCTANICRSPMAEALLSHALKAEPEAPPFIVDSAGIAATDGESPSDNSVFAMKKVGLDISGHRSSQLTPERISGTDAIFCMTSGHVRMIETIHPMRPGILRLFREFAGDGSPEVPDPYGGPVEEYLQCRDSLVEAIPGLIRFLFQEVFPDHRGKTR